MKKLNLLLLLSLPIFPMDKPNTSTTITIDIENLQENSTEKAKQIVAMALGRHEPHLQNIIDHRLRHNSRTVLYPDLPKRRNQLLDLAKDSSPQTKDMVLRYVIHELTDSHEKQLTKKKRERRQKYVIATLGVVSTIVTSASSALAAYFAGR